METLQAEIDPTTRIRVGDRVSMNSDSGWLTGVVASLSLDPQFDRVFVKIGEEDGKPVLCPFERQACRPPF